MGTNPSRWLGCALLVLSVAAVVACGPSSSARRSSPATPAKEPAAEPERTAPAFDGPWALPGKEFEIRGFAAAGLRGTDLVVSLKRTRWSEAEMEGRMFREGYAELIVTTAAGQETVRIDMEDRQVVAGYEIAVTYVGHLDDERTGHQIPHAKIVLRRPR